MEEVIKDYWPIFLSFALTLGGVYGAWFDLRGRSLSNSRQISDLERDLEKQAKALQTELDREISEVGRRIESAELRSAAVGAELKTHEQRFHDYRVEAAEKFVTADQFDKLRTEISAGFRRLEDKLDSRTGGQQ
ncbi:hypothetical protein [Jiella marina]|uniref:hypothetical protein n=1 Tax=Jiella sp. LLJ827 TaxID=2917712 RepID=UPI002101A28D|nr:hypothetical protein [Jiella sp. LLJ827]MCQ0987559.1 hypothetical protein [Jiella sp. LLJ827]